MIGGDPLDERALTSRGEPSLAVGRVDDLLDHPEPRDPQRGGLFCGENASDVLLLAGDGEQVAELDAALEFIDICW